MFNCPICNQQSESVDNHMECFEKDMAETNRKLDQLITDALTRMVKIQQNEIRIEERKEVGKFYKILSLVISAACLASVYFLFK